MELIIMSKAKDAKTICSIIMNAGCGGKAKAAK
jgi:hypothetical protein